jgi:hypothetical protein
VSGAKRLPDPPGGVTASDEPRLSEAALDAMTAMGGALMHSYARSKKVGGGISNMLQGAVVNLAVLHWTEQIRDALDEGRTFALIFEKTPGEGCPCPHCGKNLKAEPNGAEEDETRL